MSRNNVITVFSSVRANGRRLS